MKNNRPMNYYLVNNPYSECMSFLPTEHRYYPTCISSIRTNPDFILRYRGQKVKYYPTFEKTFSQTAKDARCSIDDYRNPICAAISVAYQMKATKILLFCCDDSFDGERPGAEKLKNGLWTYPQHLLANSLVEGNMYWLSHQPYKRIRIGLHSSGPECENLPYINEDSLCNFFESEL